MKLRYTGKSKKIRRACTPPFPRDKQGKPTAPPQLVGEVDKVLPTGGVVMCFPIEYTLGEVEQGSNEDGAKGEVITKHIGAVVDASNLVAA